MVYLLLGKIDSEACESIPYRVKQTLINVAITSYLPRKGLIKFIQFILRRYWGICVVMLLVR